MLINGLGALATGVTLVIVLVAKFAEGAWVMTLLVPVLLAVFGGVRRHYHARVGRDRESAPLNVDEHPAADRDHPDARVEQDVAERAALRAEAVAGHLRRAGPQREQDRGRPASSAGRNTSKARRGGAPADPALVTLPSPYRHVFNPLHRLHPRDEAATHPDRQIAVLIPELIARRWYHHLLHNKRAAMLKALLLVRGDEDIVVINVPWYLSR